jgi:hypothetical protein
LLAAAAAAAAAASGLSCSQSQTSLVCSFKQPAVWHAFELDAVVWDTQQRLATANRCTKHDQTHMLFVKYNRRFTVVVRQVGSILSCLLCFNLFKLV